MQREVTRLLDELAPERSSSRLKPQAGSVQQHRSPNGCILQAEAAALSVTWYPEADDQDRVGEMQIILWRGVVSRRNATRSGEPAELVRQEVLNPIERPTDESVWCSRDGTQFSTPDLAAHCLALLASQIEATAS
jgi:hypothetical protein